MRVSEEGAKGKGSGQGTLTTQPPKSWFASSRKWLGCDHRLLTTHGWPTPLCPYRLDLQPHTYMYLPRCFRSNNPPPTGTTAHTHTHTLSLWGVSLGPPPTQRNSRHTLLRGGYESVGPAASAAEAGAGDVAVLHRQHPLVHCATRSGEEACGGSSEGVGAPRSIQSGWGRGTPPPYPLMVLSRVPNNPAPTAKAPQRTTEWNGNRIVKVDFDGTC